MKKNDLAIILAAGKGTRLNIDYPKPLFQINGISIIKQLTETLSRIDSMDILLVVGHQKDMIIDHLKGRYIFVEQKEPRGTADAVLKCLDYISNYKNTFVLVGDAPFIAEEDLLRLRQIHETQKPACSFLYSQFPFEVPYGRLLFNEFNNPVRVVESPLANSRELRIRDMFTSHYLFRSKKLLEYISQIRKDVVTNEYNLTDIINIFVKNNEKLCSVFVKKYWNLMGVNKIEDLDIINSYRDNDE